MNRMPTDSVMHNTFTYRMTRSYR
ncbi:hypothetical protein PROPHIGD11-1_10 [Mycobacterium phage prophiGD11-1]|nr:hypothetical protein PHIGD23-1_43 [Mycobacterium phage phiGD23-1]QPO17703.1 hypothetical protein PHIGD22-1_43 [Mycobacterium phage phiGD22-1]QPO17884.1 hypothetical protein PROPHIGD20-1_41 [Mycobacterium phage phiGD20-1]QSM01783.1 hypothetical protein PROPHIGD11-1_10 [Mycobacterium phage prophiGD11-1]QSM03115.1 hypothetical protein PROPHIGD22-1_10 [Mycobacterium phage prophiGD22-1]QSM04846.1 hypothetical protein PROPHIGD21-2_10 [Mycobacterium phage prophiGD21-2]